MLDIFKGKFYTEKAKDAKFKPPFVVSLLLFFLVLMVGSIASYMLFIPIELALVDVDTSGEIPQIYFTGDNEAWYTAWSLVFTVISSIICIIYCRFIEKRSLESMGLKKEKFFPNYLIGLIIGFLAYSVTLGIVLFAGAAEYEGSTFRNPLLYTVICIGWIMQGAEEEILCRGFLMSTLSAKLPLWAAILISSSVFGVLHIFNNGVTVLSIVNIILVGIVFALVALRFNSLIPACAFHSVWNWAQGNFYGMPVSGNYSGPSVFSFSLPEGKDLWTGGAFGIEAGLATTIVCIVLGAALIVFPQKKGKQVETTEN